MAEHLPDCPHRAFCQLCQLDVAARINERETRIAELEAALRLVMRAGHYEACAAGSRGQDPDDRDCSYFCIMMRRALREPVIS